MSKLDLSELRLPPMSPRRLPLLCPSSTMKPGASLLGVVREDGQVEWAPPGIVVDAELVQAAGEGRDPLRRFRFSKKCKERGCAQWKGDHCGVAEAVVEHAQDPAQASEALPACAIRPECRWFFDRGPSACALCTEVVTNKYVEASARSRAGRGKRRVAYLMSSP